MIFNLATGKFYKAGVINAITNGRLSLFTCTSFLSIDQKQLFLHRN